MSTWWNSDTELQLDRAVCTSCWWDIYGLARVRHLAPSDSDHVPILLQASSVPLAKRPRVHRFKFEAYWLEHNDSDEVVKQAWATDVTGSPMYCAAKKIEFTRIQLDDWQNRAFRTRQQQMLGVRARLEELPDVPMSVEVQNEKKELMSKLQNLLSQEEFFWKQRSKVTWLKEGDRNTSFFH
ncbi:uncharacterized protein LOC112199668 [Rosa chinensis]|uniref:uncharacterized protein LOC112199668 n=1 Tax=Rosa chinensis TaxID=74649 RepID=UPI000D09118D|nr:uncharacterized protein LOC112199668 [Rosa chinensis]